MINKKKLHFVFISFGKIEKIGLEYLSSALKKAGHSVSNIYFGEYKASVPEITDLEKDKAVELLRKINPDIIGIHVLSIFFELACKLSLKIKQELKVPIIWGGPQATLFPEICIKYADMVCIGEGEEAIPELARKISSGEPIVGIKNLWVKTGESIIKSEVGLIQNLDPLSFPDYKYEKKWLIKDGNIIALTKEYEEKRDRYEILTSRGCPYICTYCSNNVLHKIFPSKSLVRQRSVNNVIEELKEVKRRFPGIRDIKFFDETFTMNVNWLKEFCKAYKNQINLPFVVDTHPNNINRDIVSTLKEAGCVQINVGIQSGSEHIRKEIYKRYTSNESLINVAKILHEYNIPMAYDFIMDNPFETEDDFRQTLDLMIKMRPFKLRLYSLAFLPKTEITQMALDSGLITTDQVSGANPDIHEFYRWGGNTNYFKEAESGRTKENIFWSNLFIITKYSFIPEKILWALSNIKLLKKYPHTFSKAVSWFDLFVQKYYIYKNYFKVGLDYLFKGEVLKLLFKIKKKILKLT